DHPEPHRGRRRQHADGEGAGAPVRAAHRRGLRPSPSLWGGVMASLGTWPSWIGVKSARFMLQTNQRVNASPFGGSEQALDMLNDRLMCYLTLRLNNFVNG